MDAPPSWLVRVIVGFLVLNVALLAALFILGVQQECSGSGAQFGAQTFESSICQPTFWPLALVLACSGGAVGGYFVYDGLRRSRSNAPDPAPLPS